MTKCEARCGCGKSTIECILNIGHLGTHKGTIEEGRSIGTFSWDDHGNHLKLDCVKTRNYFSDCISILPECPTCDQDGKNGNLIHTKQVKKIGDSYSCDWCGGKWKKRQPKTAIRRNE